MATLHVRNVPDDVYAALRKRAEARSTSISEETVAILRSALRPERARVARFLDEVSRRPLRVAAGAPTPSELVRLDRDER